MFPGPGDAGVPGSDMTRLASADRDHAGELASPHPRLGRLGFTTDVREWAKARGIEVKTTDECPLNWVVKSQAAAGK